MFKFHIHFCLPDSMRHGNVGDSMLFDKHDETDALISALACMQESYVKLLKQAEYELAYQKAMSVIAPLTVSKNVDEFKETLKSIVPAKYSRCEMQKERCDRSKKEYREFLSRIHGKKRYGERAC